MGARRLLAALPVLFGCASLLSGPDQEIHVTSEPSGAAFRFAPTGVTGITPTYVVLPKNTSHQAVFTLECHFDRRANVPRSIGPWILGNVVTGGLGLLIDFTTGSVWKLPYEVVGYMQPIPGCVAEGN
jgi:hypothetical protein